MVQSEDTHSVFPVCACFWVLTIKQHTYFSFHVSWIWFYSFSWPAVLNILLCLSSLLKSLFSLKLPETSCNPVNKLQGFWHHKTLSFINIFQNLTIWLIAAAGEIILITSIRVVYWICFFDLLLSWQGNSFSMSRKWQKKKKVQQGFSRVNDNIFKFLVLSNQRSKTQTNWIYQNTTKITANIHP